MHRTTGRAALAAVLLGASGLVGCTSGGDAAAVPDTVAEYSPAPPDPEADREAALETFARYGDAVAEGAGSEALEVVSEESERLYDDYRLAAITATRQEILERSTVDQINILALRALLDLDQLQALDGAGTFAAAVSTGLIRAQDRSELEVDRIEIEGDRAQVFVGDGKSFVYPMIRESGQWRLDLPEVRTRVEPAFQAILAEMSVERETALLVYLGQLDADVGPGVFQPPLER